MGVDMVGGRKKDAARRKLLDVYDCFGDFSRTLDIL